MARLAFGVAMLVVIFLIVPCYVLSVYAQEPTLVEILNYLGFTSVTETTVETFPAGTFNVTLYAEFAGLCDVNELSYYEVGTDVFNVIFTGPEGSSGYVSPPISKMFTADYEFGLSVLSPEYRYFTEISRNPDLEQHAKVYRNLDDPYMFLIGYENLFGAGDRDYNDLVFSLRYEVLPISVSISPMTTRIKIGESVAFTSAVSGGIPEYSYQWCLNGSAVLGATASTWTFAPDMEGFYTVYLDVVDSFGSAVQSDEASVTVRPRLLVSIFPLSASIWVGESVEFTSAVSGGYIPYSLQWYVGGNPVSGATSNTWVFTPTADGTYYVYLKVTDDNENVEQSVTAIVEASIPFGGYSVSLSKSAPTVGLIYWAVVIVLFGAGLSVLRRKRK